MSLTRLRRTPRVLSIYWMLTDFCNFACSYCPKALHSGDFFYGRRTGHPSQDDILSFLHELESQSSLPLHFILSGGEPTSHPDFKFLLQRLPATATLDVVTNGSRPVAWWATLARLPDQVTISLHPEFTSALKVSELADWLLSKSVSVSFNLMALPSAWPSVVSILGQLPDRLRALVSLKPINFLSASELAAQGVRGEAITYTEEQQTLIAKHQYAPRAPYSLEVEHDSSGSWTKANVFRLIALKQNAFKGWQCDVSSLGLNIDFGGNVYSGICKARNLGTLKNFRLNSAAITCPFEFCACPLDITFDKYKL